jgi:hypothetical protein
VYRGSVGNIESYHFLGFGADLGAGFVVAGFLGAGLDGAAGGVDGVGAGAGAGAGLAGAGAADLMVLRLDIADSFRMITINYVDCTVETSFAELSLF